MKTRTSIMKSAAICLLGLVAAAPLASAEVSEETIEFIKNRTEVKEYKVRGKEVSKEERTKNAKRKGAWTGEYAKFLSYAQVKRNDDTNRILCTAEYEYNTKVFYEGEDSTEVQLVHMKVNEKTKEVKVTEVEEIDPEAGGVYVLFTPDTLYVVNYEKPYPDGEPLCRKYLNRTK